MPYFIRWTYGTNKAGKPIERVISVQTLNEEDIKKHLVDKGFLKFSVEYYEYTNEPQVPIIHNGKLTKVINESNESNENKEKS